MGDADVRDDVFGVAMNPGLVHQVMVGQLANARQGTSGTKTRAQVSGGGRKPRPQKASGQARQGSIRAPHYKGGGVVFGPNPRDYSHRTPKRMKRQSLVAVLSDKVRQGQLVVIDALVLDQPKTREMVKVLDALDLESSVLLVADGAEDSVLRCVRNISRVGTSPACLLNTLDLLKHRQVVMTLEAVRNVEKLWGGGVVRRRRQIESRP